MKKFKIEVWDYQTNEKNIVFVRAANVRVALHSALADVCSNAIESESVLRAVISIRSKTRAQLRMEAEGEGMLLDINATSSDAVVEAIKEKVGA